MSAYSLPVNEIDLPLSEAERARWTELRSRVRRGFRQIGMDLAEVHDKRLYRETYSSFEACCQEEFKLKRQRAYELMDAAKIAEEVSEKSDTSPGREAHAAALAALPAVLRPLAWDIAVATCENSEPTTAHVKSTVEQVQEVAITGAIEDEDGGQIPIGEATTADVRAAIRRKTMERQQRKIIHIEENSKTDSVLLTGVIVASGDDTHEVTIRIDGDAANLIGSNVRLYVTVAKSSTEHTTE